MSVNLAVFAVYGCDCSSSTGKRWPSTVISSEWLRRNSGVFFRRYDHGEFNRRKLNKRRIFKASAESVAVIGPSAAYAKEMERLAAKESLLLAFSDSGGLSSLVNGKVTDIQRIDVNERITSLERLNPTPRPTTSPFLEGRWNFEWFGSGTPGLFAARLLFRQFPEAFASLLGMDILIKNSYATTAAKLKLLSVIESKFVLTTKLAVEGPLRMKEEYTEGLFETPTFKEEAIPEQLKGVYTQLIGAVEQLPLPLKDVMATGLKIPLSGTYQRMFMISYLDEEILIIRDTSGVPDVLSRLEAPDYGSVDPVPEYES